ncbi:hypothetical protein HDU93_006144 [Gonapodya sp. JEL0774]|nr:hypothetical protein HDU93_006144 [Gonapodya sp. JEL0774]
MTSAIQNPAEPAASIRTHDFPSNIFVFLQSIWDLEPPNIVSCFTHVAKCPSCQPLFTPALAYLSGRSPDLGPPTVNMDIFEPPPDVGRKRIYLLVAASFVTHLHFEAVRAFVTKLRNDPVSFTEDLWQGFTGAVERLLSGVRDSPDARRSILTDSFLLDDLLDTLLAIEWTLEPAAGQTSADLASTLGIINPVPPIPLPSSKAVNTFREACVEVLVVSLGDDTPDRAAYHRVRTHPLLKLVMLLLEEEHGQNKGTGSQRSVQARIDKTQDPAPGAGNDMDIEETEEEATVLFTRVEASRDRRRLLIALADAKRRDMGKTNQPILTLCANFACTSAAGGGGGMAVVNTNGKPVESANGPEGRLAVATILTPVGADGCEAAPPPASAPSGTPSISLSTKLTAPAPIAVPENSAAVAVDAADPASTANPPQSQSETPAQSEPQPSALNHNKLLRCSACSMLRYCSKDCQAEDWKWHKKMCGKRRPPDGWDNVEQYKNALLQFCLVFGNDGEGAGEGSGAAAS